MINAWWLLLIIPVSAFLGAAGLVLLAFFPGRDELEAGPTSRQRPGRL